MFLSESANVSAVYVWSCCCNLFRDVFSQFILIKLAELTASTECNVKLGRFMKINPISTNLLDSSKRPTLWSVTGAS